VLKLLILVFTAAIAFSVLILILLPIRKYILPKCFGKKQLKSLDGNSEEIDENKSQKDEEANDQTEVAGDNVEMANRKAKLRKLKSTCENSEPIKICIGLLAVLR